jgi:hypothetical protein
MSNVYHNSLTGTDLHTHAQMGIASGTQNCAQNVHQAISFGFTYAVAPVVVCTACTENHGYNAATMVYSTSTTGAVIINPNSTSLDVNWIAIGTPA